MQSRLGPWAVCLVLPLALWRVAATTGASRHNPGAPDTIQTTSQHRDPFAGASSCARCHESEHRTGPGARHSQMLQPAKPGTVSGDFSRGAITLRGTRFVLGRSGDRFTIAGAFPAAREEVHRVDYTLGSR